MWGVVAAALGVVAITTVLFSGGDQHPGQRHTIAGTLTLPSELDCMLSPRYGGIHPGAPIEVSDESGEPIARGSLGRCVATSVGVHFSFTLENVPSENRYGFQVSDRRIGDVGRRQLAHNGWVVELIR